MLSKPVQFADLKSDLQTINQLFGYQELFYVSQIEPNTWNPLIFSIHTKDPNLEWIHIQVHFLNYPIFSFGMVKAKVLGTIPTCPRSDGRCWHPNIYIEGDGLYNKHGEICWEHYWATRNESDKLHSWRVQDLLKILYSLVVSSPACHAAATGPHPTRTCKMPEHY